MPLEPASAPEPVVVAVDMGYGHLRAATPIAEALGTTVLQVDRAPVVRPEEERLWARVRKGYELVRTTFFELAAKSGSDLGVVSKM